MTNKASREFGLYPEDIVLILLEHELSQVQRYGIPLSLLRIAVQIPGSADAAALESVRSMMANVLSSNLRVADVAGHHEEDFLVILPSTDEAGSRLAAARLIGAVADLQPTHEGEASTRSICIGIASTPRDDSTDAADLIAQTTAALEAAVQKGPHSIVAYSEIGEVQAAEED